MVKTGETGLTVRLATRALLFVAVLAVVNFGTYATTNFLALRGPMAMGYVPDTQVPFFQIFQGYPEYVDALLRGDINMGWVSGVARGGDSAFIELSMLAYIGKALVKSLILLGMAFLVAAVVGVGLGLLSVNPRTRQINPVALVVSMAGFSMPGFYLGILILVVMLTTMIQGQTWTFLPVSGYGLDEHLILPVLTLSVRPTAEVARLVAELLIEELRKEYVRAARAKGLPWRLVVVKHAFRNIAATFVTALGNSLSYLLGSLVIIEGVFLWPGIGHTLLDAITLNNFAGTILNPVLITTLATTWTLLFLIMDLFTDFTSRALDPRLRKA